MATLAQARTHLPNLIGNIPATLAAIILGAPVIAAALAGVFAGGGETWTHILGTGLLSGTVTTIATLAITAMLMLLIAVPAAWLVTMYAFPGRGFFEWLLILPLAAPGYVLAIAYAELLGVAGPVQSVLRDATGWSARDYWFPDINSIGGLGIVLAAALYPYVYLTARAAFTSSSVCALDAARTLGASPFALFWRVAIPAARPAIVAGLALALMEAAADYGAAEYLGVRTLTVSLFRAWTSFGDAGVAARMALILFGLALVLQWLERIQRGGAGSQATSRRWQQIARKPLSGAMGWAAAAFCAAIFAYGFAVPIVRLVWIAAETNAPVASLSGALTSSIVLAGMGAALCFLLALAVALTRDIQSPIAQLARAAASGGYAIPGAVLALGGLIVLQVFGLSLTGPVALVALVWVYASRFTAAGIEPLQTALARAPRSMRDASRALGASPWRRSLKVELPLAAPGAFVAALILFVEILKELPATLMLRPLNWETLAVRAFAYASDERLAAAAAPCLMITAAGLVPVMFLSWRLSLARPGGAA